MNEDMNNHRFFGRNQNTPLMAPIGVISREYLNNLGGIDKRYISGQYENDIAMRLYADGGNVYSYKDICVDIEHLNKHQADDNFKGGYNEDREQLENSWCVNGYKEHPTPLVVISKKHSEPPHIYWPLVNHEVTLKRNDKHEPYPINISLTESEDPRGIWK